MKAAIRTVEENGREYKALMFACPGCAEQGRDGLHLLPIGGDTDRPRWDFDGNLEAPTLSPSILTSHDHHRSLVDGEWRDVGRFTCHSFLRGGVFEFLTDSTHPLAGQQVPIPDLPDWAAREG